MTAGADVNVVERRPTHLASWSLVDAELRALRLAVQRSEAEHIVVMSGADYPLASMQQIRRELDGWRGRSLMSSSPLPWGRWSTRVHGDGGLWRLQRRFLTRSDEVLFVGGLPVRLPWKRLVPGDVELRGSSQRAR